MGRAVLLGFWSVAGPADFHFPPKFLCSTRFLSSVGSACDTQHASNSERALRKGMIQRIPIRSRVRPSQGASCFVCSSLASSHPAPNCQVWGRTEHRACSKSTGREAARTRFSPSKLTRAGPTLSLPAGAQDAHNHVRASGGRVRTARAQPGPECRPTRPPSQLAPGCAEPMQQAKPSCACWRAAVRPSNAGAARRPPLQQNPSHEKRQMKRLLTPRTPRGRTRARNPMRYRSNFEIARQWSPFTNTGVAAKSKDSGTSHR